jgi:pimeloyl-ACP methyl ester carboxylesterase
MMPTMPYQTRRQPTPLQHTLRDLQAHAWAWEGDPALPLRVLLHGWMDVADSFQFLVDAFQTPAPVVALDWRGFGHSETPQADAYWFADYLGDLDAWLQQLSPGVPVDLVAHSMGGNVGMLYAGVRPARVRRLVNLEGYGMPDMPASMAPERLARWLDELQTPAVLKPYPSLEAVAERLRKTNPRLAPDKATWLASRWAEAQNDGSWRLRADPKHKRSHAVLYRKAEAMACWARISAPVLFVEGSDDALEQFWGGRYPRADLDERLTAVPQLQRARVADAGHMLHHDQPEALAQLIDDFL